MNQLSMYDLVTWFDRSDRSMALNINIKICSYPKYQMSLETRIYKRNLVNFLRLKQSNNKKYTHFFFSTYRNGMLD